MKYRHVKDRENYSPYASGQVFYSIRGHPPLPVRLSDEIFLRAYHIWSQAHKRPCTIYDPMCGSGTTIVTLKFLHWDLIGSILGSDISPESLDIAALNANLLTKEGMAERMAKIAHELEAYGKDSHKNALAMTHYLLKRIASPPITHLFHADATNRAAVQLGVGDFKIDIAFLDIPYGRVSSWQGDSSGASSQDATAMVLDALTPVMSSSGVVALFMPKKHKIKIQADRYTRIQRIKAGKREVWLLQPNR